MSSRCKGLRFPALLVMALTLLAASPAWAARTCEELTSLVLPHTTVGTAEEITSGSFTVPGTTTTLTGLPSFCRVLATATPTSDSVINIEVWIPTGGSWNGKYEQVGCGGFCGAIYDFQYVTMATAIQRGYAAAATDDGNQDNGAPTFALGHPEKIIDFGYRALKETTDTAKAILRAYSGMGPRLSYFNGCSDGGREALMEAQRFPDDFDGIIVGSPANAWTRLFSGFIWNEQALLGDPASYVPPSLLPVLSAAVRAQCAGQDGGVPTDPFLNDPRDCRFDPASVQCKPGQDPTTCLTAAQVLAVRKIYAGLHDPATGRLLFPGYEPGSEANPENWPAWITGPTPGGGLQQFFGNGFFADFVFQDPGFDWRTFTFPDDVRIADETMGPIINSTDTDLGPFMRHGGKMIHYVGWADAAIAPMNSVNYYEAVRTAISGKKNVRHDRRSLEAIRDFYRLFMVPGMAHCSGGDGPNAFGNFVDPPVVDAEHDLLAALDRWVEEGDAPDKIIGTHYVDNTPASGVEFQRPLCPYPEVAWYQGGDSNNAANFRCVMDERDRDPRDLNMHRHADGDFDADDFIWGQAPAEY